VVRVLEGQGGGSLFVKTHPKSKQPVRRHAAQPGREDQPESVAVFDVNNLDQGLRRSCRSPSGRTSGEGPKRVVQPEFNKAGDEVWFSVWNGKDQESAIVVVDDKTLELKP
jgi:nitrite reductase (NO-forming) / hydroxylamine reductase